MDWRIGTSGYSYSAWKGRFYPQKLRNQEMLSFYSRQFDSVEINNTFYNLPTEDSVRSWTEEVERADFVFSVKAPQQITHHKRLVAVENLLAEFLALAAILGKRLGPLLFQLPPNFKLDLQRLSDFLSILPKKKPIAFEFRHETWFNEDVFSLLRKHKVALCIAEDEKLATPLVATTDWGYLRLRREDYRRRDIQEWATRIAGQNWSQAFVYLKHEDTAKGPRLAKYLRSIVDGK